MSNHDTKRLARLTAILTQLQTKRLTSAPRLAEKFTVSIRTIYRDIKALEQAGVPIVTEAGKGYSLLEGYRMPPIMFTEREANALITAEQLVLKNNDTSLIRDYAEAIQKIKAVLQASMKDKAELLSQRILVRPQLQHTAISTTLSAIQAALTEFRVVQIVYHSGAKDETTQRAIEPFALYNNTQEHWNVIAFCRLRRDFRLFRLDRIQAIGVTDERFEPHKLTLEEYVVMQRAQYERQRPEYE